MRDVNDMNIKKILYSLIVLYLFIGCSKDDFDDYKIHDLSELDLSGAPGLKKLVCSNNKLEKLDVSENIALTILNCEFNEQLTVLDLRNNKNLQNFSCGNNENPITVYLFKDYSQNKYVINGTIIYV